MIFESFLENPWRKFYVHISVDRKSDHVQTEVAARPLTLFKRILLLHLHIHDLYQ